MTLKKEFPLLTIVLLPFLYLAYIWNTLPEKVPIHWNVKGTVDRYGDKWDLLWILVTLPLLMYVVLLVAQKIDPKKKLQNMGNKFQTLRKVLVLFMSVLALFILHSAQSQVLFNSNYILLLIGILYMVLGNYFKTIKANYFIGIKTPWTLENETVWKKTHSLAGKMWFIGGLIVTISCLTLSKETNHIVFISITGIITIIPVVFSYYIFNKIEKN